MRVLLGLIFTIFFSQSLHGQNWDSLGGGLEWSARALYADSVNDYLYVGGTFTQAGNINTEGIARWDGTTWDSLGSGLNQGARVITRFKDTVYTTGNFWGTNWYIAKWNGAQWDSVAQVDGSIGGFLNYQDSILYVCGEFDSIDGVPINSIGKWDGTNWSVLNGTTLWNAQIHVMVIYYGELYIGGNFYNNGLNKIAKWNGVNWEPVGSGFIGGLAAIGSMVVYKDELYVAGSFSKTENEANPGNYIARWDGVQWKDVGGGVMGLGGGNGQIHALEIYKDELYAGGVFSFAGGVPAKYIAKWDGEKWCSFGDQINNRILTMEVFDDDFYIGGGFTWISGDTIKYIAQLSEEHQTDSCGVVGIQDKTLESAVNIYPNPVSDVLTLNARDNKVVNYTIYDITGRQLLCETFVNTQEVDVSAWPSGVYIVQSKIKEDVYHEKLIIQH